MEGGSVGFGSWGWVLRFPGSRFVIHGSLTMTMFLFWGMFGVETGKWAALPQPPIRHPHVDKSTVKTNGV
jgi:hypothetical protein